MLRIGVVFEGDLQSGGGYQQQLTTIQHLQSLNKYTFIAICMSDITAQILAAYGFETLVYHPGISWISKCVRLIRSEFGMNPIWKRLKRLTPFEAMLKRHDLDLIYFLSPSTFARELRTHNFIITLWDLCHRDHPEFPEVNFYGEFENRDHFLRNTLPKATAVLVDSEYSKYSLSARYGIDVDRIASLPFFQSPSILATPNLDIRNKYGIQGPYVYYPAQFWAHKNHVYIIDSIAVLSEEGITITAIFSGADKGNLAHVITYAAHRGVTHLIRYIGFVPSSDMYSLYYNAIALVMPTYFGPTNIPPLDAFSIGTPVIYSNLPGLRDQVGNAALLCDLTNPASLAMHLKTLITYPEVRFELIQKGHHRLSELTDYSPATVLADLFDRFAIKLTTWKSV